MSGSAKPIFHLLQPGKSIENDWSNFRVPDNIDVGKNTVFDSSYCFKKFFSELTIGLKIGNNVTIQSTSFAAGKLGYIEIGDFCYLSSCNIVASQRIIIGNYVYLAGGVTIVDTDFHPIDAASRITDTVAISTVGNRTKRPHFDSLPVIIEDDVWIGYNATILKGVIIGEGAIIEPGALVTKNVPANSIISGNPGIIKNIDNV